MENQDSHTHLYLNLPNTYLWNTAGDNNIVACFKELLSIVYHKIYLLAHRGQKQDGFGFESQADVLYLSSAPLQGCK